MFKVEEITAGAGYSIVTFMDGQELYGSLVVLEEDGLYVEFMEFKDNELYLITEDETPEEYNRLEEKYLDDILNVLEN